MLRTRLPFFPLFLDREGDPSGPGAATVVPPVPGGQDGRNDSQPGLHGERGAALKAVDELRAAYQRGEIAMVGETPKVQPSATIEVPDPNAAPADGVETDQPADAAGLAAAEGEAATPEAAAAAEGAEGAGADDDPLLTIELVPRRGQDPITIKVEDRETAEALRATRNLAGRAEQAEEQLGTLRQQAVEIEAFEHLLEVDPVGTLIDKLHPRHHVTLAEHVLAQLPPEAFEAVRARLNGWEESPDRREADAARFENTRIKTRGEVQQKIAVREHKRAVVDRITQNVQLLEELVSPEIARQFRSDALGDLAAYIRENRVPGHVAPERFPEILATRLRLYGITPDQARAALTTDARTPHPSPRPRPKGPAAEALAASQAAQGSTANGQQFIKASRVRKVAAAGAPGAGAPVTVPAGARPPKGTGVKGTINWLRQQAGIPPKP